MTFYFALCVSGMQELNFADMFPEPAIVSSALRACRRVNDYALAVRFLEQIRQKCGPRVTGLI